MWRARWPRASQAFEAHWRPVTFDVSEVAVLTRRGYLDPFALRAAVPLGHAPAPPSPPHAASSPALAPPSFTAPPAQSGEAPAPPAPPDARPAVSLVPPLPYVATVGPLTRRLLRLHPPPAHQGPPDGHGGAAGAADVDAPLNESPGAGAAWPPPLLQDVRAVLGERSSGASTGAAGAAAAPLAAPQVQPGSAAAAASSEQLEAGTLAVAAGGVAAAPFSAAPTLGVWFFAYGGAHASARQLRQRGAAPLASRPGRVEGVALGFNARGGHANLMDPHGEGLRCDPPRPAPAPGAASFASLGVRG